MEKDAMAVEWLESYPAVSCQSVRMASPAMEPAGRVGTGHPDSSDVLLRRGEEWRYFQVEAGSSWWSLGEQSGSVACFHSLF